MVAMAFPSRSRLTLSELRQAISFTEDAGLISHPLTHATLEVFFIADDLSDPTRRFSPPSVHLNKSCTLLLFAEPRTALQPVLSRTVRVELLTSDVLDLCERCAAEPLGRQLHHTMALLLLASNAAILTRRLRQICSDHSLKDEQVCEVVASLYALTSTLKKDLSTYSVASQTVRDIDDVLARAAAAVAESRDRMASALSGRASSAGFSDPRPVLAYFEHAYVSPWKQDPVESLIRFAWDDPEFITYVFSCTSPHAVGDSSGLIVLPHCIAELWSHTGHPITVVAVASTTFQQRRLQVLMPLMQALMNQGEALSDPHAAFAAASALIDDLAGPDVVEGS